uniref:Uncharacterized protein n=1 Tax=viral metagenome TaxID=1070528 RepID=A0A6C0JYF7_9ZZZZ
MAFLPQAFLSNINTKDGLAKPSRFQVILPIPTYIGSFISQSIFEQILNLPNGIIADITSFLGDNTNQQSVSANPSISRYLSLQCESAALPGKALLTSDVKIYGPTYKVPYQTQYTDMNLTFLCSSEFYERKIMDRWIEAIHPTDTNNLRYAKDTKTRFLTNIKIIQYDDFIRQIYAIELLDAYPIAISDQPLAWAEDGFHRLTVQFAYQKFRTIYNGNYDLVDFALTVFGSKAQRWIDKTTGKLISPVGEIFANKFPK